VARADDPARLVLIELARRPWRRVARLASQLDESSPPERLHELRILVKRARYAAAAAALVHAGARRHASELARLQGTLGEINDATVTEERLRAAVASGLGADAAYAAGLVVAAERRRARRRRSEWLAHWEQARRKKVRAWLDSSQ
jgi:CHAD domain-containing protein